ncbi:MAG: hypothetical protein IPP71_18185 [Bacteroidetes bacterium]|nr:hypothetical protein [Bacteroidota bacterium]
MGFGTVWRSTIRPEAAAQRIITDPHSPTNYRCNGVVSNMRNSIRRLMLNLVILCIVRKTKSCYLVTFK